MSFELRDDAESGKNMWLETIGNVEDKVFYVFAALSAFVLVLSLAIFVLTCIYKHISPGFTMDFFIAAGSLTIIVHVLMQGSHKDWGDEDDYEALCQVGPAVILMGWTFFIGGILFKTWAFLYHFTFGKRETIRHSEWIPNFCMAIVILIMAALVVIWAIEYPMHIYKEIDINKNGTTIWECKGKDMDTWKIVTSAILGGLLFIAAMIVWGALHVVRNDKRSGEANGLCLLVYNTAFAVVAGTLVYFFYDDTDNILYAIIGGLQFYAVIVGQCLIIHLKIKASRREPRDTGNAYTDIIDEGSTSGSVNPAMQHAEPKDEDEFNY